MILVPSHDNDFGNQSRDFPQPVPGDPVRQSGCHLRDDSNKRLRPSGVKSLQKVLRDGLTFGNLWIGNVETNLGFYLPIRPTAGVSFYLCFQPRFREQYAEGI